MAIWAPNRPVMIPKREDWHIPNVGTVSIEDGPECLATWVYFRVAIRLPDEAQLNKNAELARTHALRQVVPRLREAIRVIGDELSNGPVKSTVSPEPSAGPGSNSGASPGGRY